MSDICRQWQQNGQIDMDWYFELAERFGSQKIIFNSVQIESPLFNRLKEKTKEHQLAPVYVVTAEQFLEIKKLQEHLNEGVHYTILIYSPLSTEMICLVDKMQAYLSQLSFVILARKDWNVRNCYRSVPHFMRSRLYVDFPVSIHESDPFYEPAELTSTRQNFEKDFLDHDIPSFCPNLGLYNEWGKKNISHFSKPRKLLKTKPKVSIIALDPDKLKPLLNSKVLQKSPEDFEILITRVAGQKTKVIPKIKAVTSTRYWAHPIDSGKQVSEKVLANFTASQADGDILVFLDSQNEDNLDGLFSVLLAGDVNFGKLLIRKNLFVFSKQGFFSAGGFDDLLTSWDADRIRLQNTLYSSLLTEEQTKNIGTVLKSVENSCDQLLLAHRFADRIEDFGFLAGGAPKTQELMQKKIYEEVFGYHKDDLKQAHKVIYQSSVGVAVEGSLKRTLDFVLRYLQLHAWRLSPLRIRHQLRVNYWQYNIFHHAYHFIKMHRWRLNPLSYAWIYKITYWFRYLPQRVYGWWVQGYWLAYRVAFPLRKIYYFLHFQYEKRILGLHSKRTKIRES